jgi:hypothetical protein
MITIRFPAEWALSSSLRVKYRSIRLTAWTAMLCGSLAMPALEPKKAVEVFVVDHMERTPAGN